MKLWILSLTAMPLVLAFSLACGDGANDEAPTAEVTAAGTPDRFGPAPDLTKNIVKITPEHAASVKRATTITTNQLNPKGVCVEVTFENLPQYGQSFRFIVDEKDVTAGGDTVWVIASTTSPRDGTLCYAPRSGLAIGKHTAAIGVQDPNHLSAPFTQVVAWAFEVTE